MFAVPAAIGNRHYHMFSREFFESVKGSCAKEHQRTVPSYTLAHARTMEGNYCGISVSKL